MTRVPGPALDIPRELYPFDSHFFDRNGLRLHYLDEGQGDPVVMVHGNPTWSFYYRELVKALRGTHRVIVPDHIGCGLSDKPGDDRYAYTLQSRVDDLDALLEHLGVTKNVTLVVHDWGGMIGTAWATRHLERIKRLVIFNTAGFRNPPSKPRLPFTLWLGRNTPVGTLLIRGFNAFARGATKMAMTRKSMSRAVADAYCAPYNSWQNRIATLRFVQDIPLADGDPGYAIVKNVEEHLAQFRSVPTLICWGSRDFVFDDHFLAEWRRHLPGAEVHEFKDAGHYVVEDASEEVVPLVTKFLAAHPIVERAA